MKKIGIMLVAGALAASLLTGCGGDGKKETAQRLSRDPVTLSVYIPKPSYVEDLETNEFTLWYEQQTGVHIDWQVATGNQEQSMNLMLASGDYPDIIMNSYTPKPEQAVYGKQGVLLDIKDLIEGHTTYIKKMLQDRDDIRQSITTPEGQIYGLPIVNEVYHTKYPAKMWVNQTWLDQLGLDVPQTTEEFYQMLVAFRDRDPNGNGIADEIPMASTSVMGSEGYDVFLMNAFLYCDDRRVMQENGTVVFTANQPQYREGLRYLRRLYQEGLLHRDSLIMDRKRLTGLVERGETATVGAVPGLWYGMFTDMGSGSTRYQDYVAIPPLTGPQGVRLAPRYGGAQNGWDINITSACKQPEVAIQWIDWFYSKEGTLTTQNGFEGVGWRYAKEGETGLDGKQAVWARLQPFGVMQNRSWMNMGVYYMDEAIRLGIIVDPAGEQTEQDLYQATKEYYEPYGANKFVPDLFFPPEKYSEFIQLRMQLIGEIKRSMAAFVDGEKSLDTDWDAYLQRLDELGLPRFMEIYREMYEENKPE